MSRARTRKAGRPRRRGRARASRRTTRKRQLPRLAVVGALGLGGAALAVALFWHQERRAPTSLADPGNVAQVGLGERLYAEHCASCHGAELEGQPNWRTPLPDGRLPAPPHDPTGHTWHHDDAYLFQVTKRGGQAVARGFPSGMPAFGEELTDAEVWAVLAFIKSRWPPEIRARQGRAHR